MKTRSLVFAGIAGMILSAAGSAFSDDGTGSFYGKIYSDWYYDIGDSTPSKKEITKHSEFEISRVYLGYKYTINETFGVNALLDVGRSNLTTDAGKTDKRYFAFLKTAQFTWKNIVPYTTLNFGQIGCFAFNVQEGFWGHRYLYASLMDKMGWENSADLGASFLIAPNDMIKITAGVFNGEGYKNPQDDFGNYRPSLSLQINPVKDFTLYVYGDWMPIGKDGESSQSTASVFAGYNILGKAKIGVEYDAQMKQAGVEDHDVGGLSIVGMYNISDPFEIFARFDMMTSKDDWNTSKDGQTVIAGFQYKPVSKVKIALDFQHSLLKADDAIASDRIYLNGEFDY